MWLLGQFPQVPISQWKHTVLFCWIYREARLCRKKGRSSGGSGETGRSIFAHSQHVLMGLPITAFLQTNGVFTPTFGWPWGLAWNTTQPLIYWDAMLWRDKKMSFLVIYVSNSESTLLVSHLRGILFFCADFPRTKVSIPKLHPGKEKQKTWKSHKAISATRSTAPVAHVATSWHPWHKQGPRSTMVQWPCFLFASHLQNSRWAPHCPCHMAASPQHCSHCLQKIKCSCCYIEAIMRHRESGLTFPSGKLKVSSQKGLK